MLIIAKALAHDKQLSSSSDSPRLDCEVLLSFVIDKTRTYLYTWPEKTLDKTQEALFLECLQRRISGEPIAYIIGQKEFWSLLLCVNTSTLIPRPETELLVETALELLRNKEDAMVADLGTGTGAIALALASEQPRWQIYGLEKNKSAFALAQKNQQQLELSNVTFLLSDWFDALLAQEQHPKFHLIASNPPYIDNDDSHLVEGDVRFEPRSALVAKDSGLADIKYIINNAASYLLPEGWLVFEHGYQQADVVKEYFELNGFTQVFTRNDLSGQPRVTSGQWCK